MTSMCLLREEISQVQIQEENKRSGTLNQQKTYGLLAAAAASSTVSQRHLKYSLDSLSPSIEISL